MFQPLINNDYNYYRNVVKCLYCVQNKFYENKKCNKTSAFQNE